MKILLVKERWKKLTALAAGLLVAGITFLCILPTGWPMYIVLCTMAAMGVAAVITLGIRVHITRGWGVWLLQAIAAAASIFLLHISITAMITLKSFLSDLFIMLGILLLLMGITGRAKAPAYIWITICFVYGLINQAVMQFRGGVITLNDVFSIGTALSVAGNYRMKINMAVIMNAFVFICCMVLLTNCKIECERPRRLRTRVLALVLAVVLPMAPISQLHRFKPNFWGTQGVRFNGFLMQFLVEYESTKVTPPEGYSTEGAVALLEDAAGPAVSSEKPHMIVIMDEAFSDLSVLGDFETDADPLTFYNEFKQNTLHGWALSSVYGGNTANSEWEFLTGNSMMFMPANSVPYRLYVDENSPTLVDCMNSQGYRSVAMHPYHADGWERDNLYPKMGFDEIYFLDDLEWGSTVRDYVSDDAFVEELIRLYEGHTGDEPLFLFGITMQNHGGYDREGLDATVHLQGLKKEYPDAEQYLSLIQLTDAALEKLIAYFESVDEKVQIVIFGDHQPKLDSGFYAEIGATDNRTAAVVPFCIWKNYEADTREITVTSLNFLPAMALESAGLELPPYYRWLLNLQQKLPAINSAGYVDAAGNYGTLDKAEGEAAVLLKEYDILQHANMFDPEIESALFTGAN